MYYTLSLTKVIHVKILAQGDVGVVKQTNKEDHTGEDTRIGMIHPTTQPNF
jgi:hypothetical protein